MDNLRNVDFDVVIIDEVSKASDIELLIPILYGKSVILVGDHRQLPPLFKYKEGMFEGLTIDKRETKETLDKYEQLVESSLFKKLFSEAKDNKFMLVKQYRSHKQIMDIVNLFYEDKLILGNSKEQNNLKGHYLEVNSNELKLFTKDIHTYWFNSYYNRDYSISYEKKLIKGGKISSSFYNESEIEITKNLLVHLLSEEMMKLKT
jgi:superfamily I DNA and/or RNA helicase